jgi:YD repeat-containing protein
MALLRSIPIYNSGPITVQVTGKLLECPASGSPSTEIGDPCDVSTGDFKQTEPDYSAAGLVFTRYYHSATLDSGHAIGVGWTHSFAAYLVINGGQPFGIFRPDGHHDVLSSSSTGGLISLSGAGIHIAQSGSQWVATLSDGSQEIYSSSGQLVQTVAAAGQITILAYDTANRLSSVTGPFGHVLQFLYDASNRISTVIEPDGSTIT